jgi:hypothetical protein
VSQTLGALWRSSMPFKGTTCVLTFNLVNILAESADRSNALFWLTVWLTVKRSQFRAARDAIQTRRFDDLGAWTSGRGPGFADGASQSDLDLIIGGQDAGACVSDRRFA